MILTLDRILAVVPFLFGAFLPLSSGSPRVLYPRSIHPYANHLKQNTYYSSSNIEDKDWRNSIYNEIMEENEDETRNEELMENYSRYMVRQNIESVIKMGECKLPTRKCLHKNEIPTGNAKRFNPNCAMVHRCEHDSGCCESTAHVCAPVEEEEIKLYFSVLDHRNKEKVEVEIFQNHTRCGCVLSQKYLALSTCHCPSEFTPVPSLSGCVCDCNRKTSKACKRIKKGRRTYPRKGCKGRCGTPVCDYGDYNASFGKCPKKSKSRKTSK